MTFEGWRELHCLSAIHQCASQLCAWKLLALEKRELEDAKKGQLDFFSESSTVYGMLIIISKGKGGVASLIHFYGV